MERLNDNNFKNVVDFLMGEIKNNQRILEKLHKEDNEIHPFEFDVSQLMDLIKSYQIKNKNLKNQPKVLIQHYGNPYVTTMLCLESLQNCAELIIGIEDICYGLNMAIVKMFDDAIKENKINTQIFLENNLREEEIQRLNLDKIICLGNSNAYMRFRKIKTRQVKFVPLFNILLYYDAEEYQELAENIRYYANRNFYEVEILDETEGFEEVIYEMKHSENQYCAVMLSKDQEKQERFKREIHTQIICINQNPFHQIEWKIPEGIFE